MKRCTSCLKRIWPFQLKRFDREDRLTLKLYHTIEDISDIWIHKRCWNLAEKKRKARLKDMKEWEKYYIEFQQHKGHGYAECHIRGCKWHEYDNTGRLEQYKSNPR